MPAFTVAEWGGLHENVIAAAAALQRAGHVVRLAVRPGLVATRARSVVDEVDEVDWSNWAAYREQLLATPYRADVIFAQPQHSRKLALDLAERWSVPVYVMFHGFYADEVSEWQSEVAGFAAVSGRLVEMLTGYANVPGHKVWEIPNGIADEWFSLSKSDEHANGALRVVMASRLESDKIQQIGALRDVIGALQDVSDRQIELRILGDGTARHRFVEDLSFGDRVSTRFTGWLSPEAVAAELSTAFLSVGAGRAAALSLALGTPCVGSGRFATVGLQYDENLHLGRYSNFGDYPVHSVPGHGKQIRADVASLLEEATYRKISTHARSVMYHTRRQSLVDEQLLAFLTPLVRSRGPQ